MSDNSDTTPTEAPAGADALRDALQAEGITRPAETTKRRITDDVAHYTTILDKETGEYVRAPADPDKQASFLQERKAKRQANAERETQISHYLPIWAVLESSERAEVPPEVRIEIEARLAAQSKRSRNIFNT